ncbi:MAG: hypothetical protein N3A38_13925, partial [Planctomycetota bacterium]|nr:hypothetical protein [Planctomycetota bacterium]
MSADLHAQRDVGGEIVAGVPDSASVLCVAPVPGAVARIAGAIRAAIVSVAVSRVAVAFGAAAAVLGATFLPGAGAVCGEPPAGAVRISGKVRWVRNEGGPPTAKIVEGPGGEYNIVLDEKGQSLAKVMAGESVDIFAIVEEKNGAKWARVLDHADPKVTAGHELWRRMRCGACVVLPATRNAAVPDDLRGAVPVAPARYWPYKRRFLAWARDARNLWVASDSEIIQIDLAERKAARIYGRK